MNIRAKVFGDSSGELKLIKAKAPKGVRADDLHSIPVTRQEARRVNTRDDDRHRLQRERVEVVHDGRSHDMELVNLSGGGAMVSGTLAVKLWDHVELRLGGDGRIECAVCWIKDGRLGLEFAEETRLDCSPTEQAAVLREVVARSFPEAEFEAEDIVPEESEADHDEQRTGRRHPLIWSGTLHHDFESLPVRLRNISTTGAMIECPFALPVGAEPLLELGDNVQIPARVSWALGDTAGLKFDSAFDLSRLARSRPDVVQPQWKRPSYLSGQVTMGAKSEAQWDRMSLAELKESLEGFWKY
ncbi:PilZ domain-containing protein [Sphingomonas sp.]|uniref:PilZ domain-containing protein n=1 Tax=Sphingomonas sp. TaxID=28214 RepID=UPI0025E0F408|nr:PilZ domain-containing protein [Sphingomonas sp.]MBV9527790.1 PilZ domain-containing protein [Sphingomonas sp.]